MKVVPADRRETTYGRVTKTITRYPACAAETNSVTGQCRRVAFGNTGGEQGGEAIMPTGERVRLCAPHLREAVEAGARRLE